MEKLTATVQTADWKNEKHVPHIAVEEKDGLKVITAEVGQNEEHPNTLEHHIGWIKVFFQAEDAKFPIELGSYEFNAHGEDELFTHPKVNVYVKTDAKGTAYALSYCNIHGLWEDAIEVK